MSIYNRRMFNRNARNALNASAGIQSFAPGGNVFAPRGAGPLTDFTSPITGQRFASRAPTGAGIRSLQPFDIARRFIEGGRTVGYGKDDSISPGEYATLQAAQSSFLADRALSDPTGTKLGSAIVDTLRTPVKTAAGGGAFVRGLSEGLIPTLLTPSKDAPEDSLGTRVQSMVPSALNPDFLRSVGIFDYVDQEGPKTRPSPPSPRGVVGGPTELTQDIDPALRQARDELDKKKAAEAAALSPTGSVTVDEITGEITPDMTPAPAEVPEQPDDTNQARKFPSTATDTEEGTGTGTGTGTGEAGDDTNQNRQFPETKEEIDRVINEGTPEEQEKTLDSFIKDFMDKAPGYEGADSGLILAKIGFAMAAGKSPNAIENIASAMSDGADMLIKDKAKKDEFNRQLKLSALQYGLQETGKIRAEDRLETRERRVTKDYVAGPNGVTYKGRTYGPNETVPVTVADIRDGKMPEGAMATATITALGNQAKANAASLKDALDRKKISLTEYEKQLEKYNSAVTTAITSEIGIGLLEGAMINTAAGKVTGVTPAIKSMLNEGANFFGMDLGREYETLDDVRNAMRASLQDLVPVTLGAAQSANSISNRDVDFLIEAYFGSGALDGGRLAFVTQDPGQMVKRLQRASEKMRDAQKNAFSQMNSVTNTLTPVFQPGTQTSAALGLQAEQERLAIAGLSPSGTATFTQLGLTSAGTDSATGLPRFKFG